MPWISIGALGCALAVVAGAFGAHALKARLGADALLLWETAARYLMFGALGVLATGLAQGLVGEAMPGRSPGAGFTAAGWCLLAGTAVFSGTVAVLALDGPRWLGAVTPLGGSLMIAGFVLLAWAALR